MPLGDSCDQQRPITCRSLRPPWDELDALVLEFATNCEKESCDE
jgi:hypothetical protein